MNKANKKLNNTKKKENDLTTSEVVEKDVVALKTNHNLLIQVKQSSSTVGIQAIQEITTAKNYYEAIYQESFTCLVITNNFYTESAVEIAKSNYVTLIDDSKFRDMIMKSNITIFEVEQEESQRLKKQK
jgi:HJR/Mrr/RecB family endonuclease